MATIIERVSDLLIQNLGIDLSQIKPEANLVDDLNADSLDLVELIMSFEEEFADEVEGKFEITDDEAERIVTVGDIYTFLAEKGVREPA